MNHLLQKRPHALSFKELLLLESNERTMKALSVQERRLRRTDARHAQMLLRHFTDRPSLSASHLISPKSPSGIHIALSHPAPVPPPTVSSPPPSSTRSLLAASRLSWSAPGAGGSTFGGSMGNRGGVCVCWCVR